MTSFDIYDGVVLAKVTEMVKVIFSVTRYKPRFYLFPFTVAIGGREESSANYFVGVCGPPVRPLPYLKQNMRIFVPYFRPHPNVVV